MKKILSIWMLVVASFAAHAQFYNPVSWEFSQKNLPQDEIELSFKATIEGTPDINVEVIETLSIATADIS